MGRQRELLLEITGDKALDRRLALLQSREADRIARKSVNAALTVIAKSQRAAAPTPMLRKSIGKRNAKSQRTNQITTKAGVQVTKSKARKFPHAHLLVWGTKDRETKKGSFRGRMRARRFIERATKSALGRAIAAATSKATEALREAIRR